MLRKTLTADIAGLKTLAEVITVRNNTHISAVDKQMPSSCSQTGLRLPWRESSSCSNTSRDGDGGGGGAERGKTKRCGGKRPGRGPRETFTVLSQSNFLTLFESTQMPLGWENG